MIYVISDTFFGRSSKAKDRGFADTQEMQESMIEKWNSKVNKNDIVYHLGNFAWDVISAENAFMNLNGIINLIPARYDTGILPTLNVFEDIHLVKNHIHVIETLECVLSHWPLRSWPLKNKGTLHIHGGDRRFVADLKKENRFNANCELWSLEPISLESLKEISEDFKKVSNN